MTPSRKRQLGFSLMELLIALMIIGVIATLGMKGLTKYTDRARYTAAKNEMRNLAAGLDQYYLKHGKYPDFSSWDQMVEENSPLVKQNLIQVGMPKLDGWQQPYEGKSGKGTYELKCIGDPSDQEERPPYIWAAGRGGYELRGGAESGSAAVPAPGAGK
jgi:prepilin-type N-terminal cleavage/methylation domain-containing protein